METDNKRRSPIKSYRDLEVYKCTAKPQKTMAKDDTELVDINQTTISYE